MKLEENEEIYEFYKLIDKYNEAFPEEPYAMEGLHVMPVKRLYGLLSAALNRNKPYSLEEWNGILGLEPDDLT